MIDGGPMAQKWLVCKSCGRILKNAEAEIKKHMFCPWDMPGKFRNAGNEPWWNILRHPELLVDWFKLKVETWTSVK